MGDGEGTLSIALLSGTDDKLNAAALLTAVWPTLILATTAAAMGMETIVFFTFWGLFPLVRNDVRLTGGPSPPTPAPRHPPPSADR
jgi:peroxiredoxin family protein